MLLEIISLYNNWVFTHWKQTNCKIAMTNIKDLGENLIKICNSLGENYKIFNKKQLSGPRSIKGYR